MDRFRDHLPERKRREGDGPTMRNDYVKGVNNWRINAPKNGYPWRHKGSLNSTEEERRLLVVVR